MHFQNKNACDYACKISCILAIAHCNLWKVVDTNISSYERSDIPNTCWMMKKYTLTSNFLTAMIHRCSSTKQTHTTIRILFNY